MKLYVQDPQHTIDTRLEIKLRRKIKQNLLRMVNLKKLNVSVQYLHDQGLLSEEITTKKFILCVCGNIISNRNGSRIIFEIDHTKRFKESKYGLDTLCRLINYGNMQIKGYPIFTRAFQYTSSQINKYKDIYSFVGEI